MLCAPRIRMRTPPAAPSFALQDKATGQSKGSGIVEFSRPNDAQNAINRFNNTVREEGLGWGLMACVQGILNACAGYPPGVACVGSSSYKRHSHDAGSVHLHEECSKQVFA